MKIKHFQNLDFKAFFFYFEHNEDDGIPFPQNEVSIFKCWYCVVRIHLKEESQILFCNKKTFPSKVNLLKLSL